MDGFSKFGICMICMLALVLLAMTPNSATSNGVVGSAEQFGPQNKPLSKQTDPARAYAIYPTAKHIPA
ncbi:hypothetical protein [Anderseniella sp. Alg231-50]|uniref:hypothetical protein n=1 Tax=Anderseniella sp. Alg231-50 TaxID=1922226 RepID=UPI000D56296E